MHWEANISAGVKHRFFTCKGMESEKIQIYFNCLSVFLKGERLFVKSIEHVFLEDTTLEYNRPELVVSVGR